ncbi:MAG: lipase [Bacteroidaceae bacterium]|nr:lipase [Bacteroidaceae bacterium]MBO4430264.1 lipase [Bacteroidaceae bacterium]
MYGKKQHIILLVLCALFFVSFGGGEANAQSLTTPFPSTFRNTRTNELTNGATLAPVFKKIHQHKTIKVMQIGDSHVRGNILPRTIGSTLEKYFPRMEFTYYGMNGAWARRFYEQDMINRVAAERPDLLIISFGTNEAHGNTIDERVHAETMKTLTDRISEKCPGVCFLFTTPPGSFISQRTGSYTTGTGRRRRTHYTTTKVPNQNTANVARSIVNFCNSHHMAAWDIFTIAGGTTSACTNWRNAGLMNTDCIHYLASGYTLQGKLLGEAIYKAYTGTATSGSQTRMMHGSTPKEQKPYKTVKGF